MPAGTYGSALLTVSQGGIRIIVEEKEENFLALARYLEERRSTQAAASVIYERVGQSDSEPSSGPAGSG